MRRNELRQPLRRRGAFEKLWAKRPSALLAASIATILLLSLGTLWLIRTPYPFAGEPVVMVKIPPVEELPTGSTDPAPEAASEPAEKPEDSDRQKIEILESTPQETVETEAAIVVSPRRTLKPAPLVSCRASGLATRSRRMSMRARYRPASFIPTCRK